MYHGKLCIASSVAPNKCCPIQKTFPRTTNIFGALLFDAGSVPSSGILARTAFLSRHIFSMQNSCMIIIVDIIVSPILFFLITSLANFKVGMSISKFHAKLGKSGDVIRFACRAFVRSLGGVLLFVVLLLLTIIRDNPPSV